MALRVPRATAGADMAPAAPPTTAPTGPATNAPAPAPAAAPLLRFSAVVHAPTTSISKPAIPSLIIRHSITGGLVYTQRRLSSPSAGATDRLSRSGGLCDPGMTLAHRAQDGGTSAAGI